MQPINAWTRRKLLKASIALPAIATEFHDVAWANVPSPEQHRDPQQSPAPELLRQKLLLDFGWSFHFGHANDTAKDFGFGASDSGNFQKSGNFLQAGTLAYDDSEWTSLDLPHDWLVQLPFVADPALKQKGYHPVGRAYPETSVGWYRRVFDLGQEAAGKKILLEFDGVYRDARFILNGFYVGEHSGGYDSFELDVSDFVVAGGRNVLLIRVDASLSDGWFYEGAGIYRHVWLAQCNPIRVQRWGTYVRSELRTGEATVFVRTEVVNQTTEGQTTTVLSTIVDQAGRAVGKSLSDPVLIPNSEERRYEQQIVVARPDLWSPERPHLYALISEVQVGGNAVDLHRTSFGIRSLYFDSATGFHLNGEPLKVKGTCNHQDHAGLGVALPDAVQYYRIARLKGMGSNAYRTAHNPPTPELLNACDELGMLVLDETRAMTSNPDGIAQFTHLVRRDRNHPSVFMWSLGNEEAAALTDHGHSILQALRRVAEEQDGSRPVTMSPPPTHISLMGGLSVLNVMGDNYADPSAEEFHRAHPQTPIIGTEEVSGMGTRGMYATNATKGYMNSYDEFSDTGHSSAEGWWSFSNARPWMEGGFVWTGFDYRGEPAPNEWPNISSQFGILDTCGFAKDVFYYYQSWWQQVPVLHLFPHWDWKGLEGKEISVWVYSNLDNVDLYLNGESLGAKRMIKGSHLVWVVPYRPGTLEARGFMNGKLVKSVKRETTSSPAKLILKADRKEILANGEDVVFASVEVQDSSGRVVPLASNEVTFTVSGEGKIIGLGNGDPTCHEPDKGLSRQAFCGLAMAIAQSTKKAGVISITATSLNLTPSAISIVTRKIPLRPQVPVWQREVPIGRGVTGLWRPELQTIGGANNEGHAGPEAAIILILVQLGDRLTGSVEGASGGMFNAPDIPDAIEQGTVRGRSISFLAGTVTYSGTIDADRIQLLKTAPFPFKLTQPKAPTGHEPTIGPPPDNLDPAAPPGISSVMSSTLMLRRVSR